MLLYIIIIFVALLLLKSMKKPSQFPPGPPKLPIIGSLPFMSGNGKMPSLFQGVRQLVKNHGKTAGFFIGSEPVVVISDYNILKDLLKRDEVSGRPVFAAINNPRWGNDHPGLDGRSLGLVFSQGEVWKEQRRFVSRNLRDFGFGKSSMEDMLHLEVEKLLKLLDKKTAGQSMRLDSALNISIVNALWVMLVGEKLELDDPKLINLCKTVNRLVKDVPPQPLIGLLLPASMLKLPILKNFTDVAIMESIVKDFNALLGPQLEAHIQELDGSAPRDLLDVLLDHVQGMKDKGSSFFGQMGADSIYNILVDLFMAGMETTSSTLVWTILYMLHHPCIQEKVYQEIRQVVGTERLPSLDDEDRMPYTQAVLHESFRFTGFVHLGVPRHTTKDIKVQNYVIPANTTIMSNLFYIMNDPEYWKNPEEFNPNRFLDNNGKFFKDERVIPFSVGKRYCLGQSLAEKELFLFFTGIVQKYRFCQVEGSQLPSVDARECYPQGVVRTAPKYEVLLIGR